MLLDVGKPEIKMFPDWQEDPGFIYCLSVFLVPVSFLFLCVFSFWKLRNPPPLVFLWISLRLLSHAWTPPSQASVTGLQLSSGASCKFHTANTKTGAMTVLNVCFKFVMGPLLLSGAGSSKISRSTEEWWVFWVPSALFHLFFLDFYVTRESTDARTSSIHRIVFSSSSSFQTHLHSSCTFSPFIIHQQIRCKHHFCCLSYFPDSLPLVTFQYEWINLRSPCPSFTPLPSIMLLSCPLSLILLTPPHLPPHTLHLLTSFLLLQLNSAFLLVLDLTLQPSPSGAQLPSLHLCT